MTIKDQRIIKAEVEEQMKDGRMFTSVDIGNKIKRDGYWISNSDVAEYMRTNSGVFSRYGYLSTMIRVDTDGTIWWANLYHNVTDYPDTYLARDTRAITPDQFKELYEIKPIKKEMKMTKQVTEFMFGGSEVGSQNVVRTITDGNGEPWFVGKDVCDVLELKTFDLVKRLDDDEKSYMGRTHLGLKPGKAMLLLNESGIYEAVFASRKPGAKRFKRWVKTEVLPAIRKQGAYLAPEVDFSDPANLMKILENWKLDREKLEISRMVVNAQAEKIGVDAPKVEFFDIISKSEDDVPLGDYAKYLNSAGLDTGRTRLFRLFREQGWLQADNQPYQYYLDLKVMSVHPNPYISGNGNKHITYTPYITGKGMTYFYKKIMDLLK